MTRTLGRSGIECGTIGTGCRAIGGPFFDGQTPVGRGHVDDTGTVTDREIREIAALLTAE